MLLVTIVIIVHKKKSTKGSKPYVMLTENLVLENVVYDGLRHVNSTHATDSPGKWCALNRGTQHYVRAFLPEDYGGSIVGGVATAIPLVEYATINNATPYHQFVSLVQLRFLECLFFNSYDTLKKFLDATSSLSSIPSPLPHL